MSRLVVNPGTPHAWEIHLRPGTNLLGRGPDSDFRIIDPSVSSSHCQIEVGAGTVIIRDLGSTNGTFVNQTRIREALLKPGQTVRLGGVEMVLHPAPAEAQAVPAPPPPLPPVAILAPPPPLAPPPSLATNLALASTAPAPEPDLTLATTFLESNPRFCKFHPKFPARYLCRKCNHAFCEACVTSLRSGAAVKKMCRSCGAECLPLRTQALGPAVAKGFFARLPGAFAYPLRGAGVFVIVVGILLFAGLRLSQVLISYATLRTLFFGSVFGIASAGYLFTFLQTILHSTSAEERELPDLPGVTSFLEDALFPFLRLMGLTLFCFGPAIGCAIWMGFSPGSASRTAFLASLGAGCFYFPMAFLAVAIMDTLMAANPLLVLPSILKAPLEYLTTLFLFAVAFGVYIGGGIGVARAFPEGFQTRSVGELLAMIGVNVTLNFTALYLIIVSVHVLGLIYATRQTALAWIQRAD
jgi:hypothetical protein